MKIGIIDVDSKIPNLALMKISMFHKTNFDFVEWYDPSKHYDKVYASKVFTFTPDYEEPINADAVECGGTGYSIHKDLPIEIDRIIPDYSIYPDMDKNTAYGFLTRGCPNKCKWCVVPEKEGAIRPYMDVEEIAIDGRRNLILMDNNILASDYGLNQIEKIIKIGYRVDFNQALDARLVTEDIASMLAKVKWLKYIRFGCDTHGQIGECERAISLLRRYGYSKEVFLYCIIMNFKESLERISYWKGKTKITPFAQPYRPIHNANWEVPKWQKDMARWTNRKEIYKKCSFEEYGPRKGFYCKEYVNQFNKL